MPRIGFRHSDEAKAKMRQRKLEKPFAYWLGKKRGASSKETKAKQRAAMVGRKKPDGFSLKLSKAIMGHPAYHRRGKRPDYKGFKMRSSYEIRTAKALDALGIKWEYEPRRFWFNSFTYTPDFFLPDVGVYWEVKGWFHHHGKAKVEAFRAKYPEVPLVVFTLPCIEILEHTAKSF